MATSRIGPEKNLDEGSPPPKKICLEKSINDDAVAAHEKMPRIESHSPNPVDTKSDGSKGELVMKDKNMREDAESVINSKKQQGLFETDVGITEFISTHKGFSGIIKQRYSDFLVNEINLEGNIVRLNSVSLPKDLHEKKDEDDAASPLSDEQKRQLEDLLKDKDLKKKVHISVGNDKEERTRIHTFIRHNFRGLESSTGETNGEKSITVVYKPSHEFRRREPWPSNRGNYCHFVLYKENKDTMDAVNVIAKILRMKPGSFTYAGTKDRRAKTCQMVSVNRVAAEILVKLNDRLRGMMLSNMEYCEQPLKLGDLKGNHFVVIIRNVNGSEEQVTQAVRSLEDSGFINYYGMQRFGTTAVPTHHVGRALLQSKWSEAIDLILKPRKGDSDDLARARETWMITHDAKCALRHLEGRRRCIEQTLLEGILRHDKADLVGALTILPRNTRLMYVHAYQSFIWNTVVSRRIQAHGLKVIPGDLVMKDVGKTTSENKNPEVVSDETMGNFNIHDVVLPLPGWDIIYPDNETSQWYTELLSQDGLTQQALKHKVKDYSLPGDYRNMVVRPTDVSWKMCHYENADEQLVLSDKEKLDGMELKCTNEGSLKALHLEFSLPSSTYATMAIREVLKTDTSAGHQSTLNVS